MPDIVANLSPLPTQLYVTVAAPDEYIYKKLCNPLLADGWIRLNQTLKLLPKLATRTVIRLTLVAGYNLGFEQKYADLILKAQPAFIEAKGYMFVGYSRKRLSIQNMPSHAQIKEFSSKLAELTGYKIVAERSDSRVTLLARSECMERFVYANFEKRSELKV
jgi:tRNA wybutosine-synthesizing protein 1